MKSKIDLIGEIDEMLEWFYNKDLAGIPFKNFKSQYKKISDNNEENIKVRNGCLNRLIDDKLIDRLQIQMHDYDGNPTEKVEGYRISFNGMLFYENAGYKVNLEKEKYQKRTQVLKDFLLISGAWAASLAGAGVLYFEYVKLNHHNPYGLGFWSVMVVASNALAIVLLILLSLSKK